jgi:hypothetical protein
MIPHFPSPVSISAFCSNFVFLYLTFALLPVFQHDFNLWFFPFLFRPFGSLWKLLSNCSALVFSQVKLAKYIRPVAFLFECVVSLTFLRFFYCTKPHLLFSLSFSAFYSKFVFKYNTFALLLYGTLRTGAYFNTIWTYGFSRFLFRPLDLFNLTALLLCLPTGEIGKAHSDG